jgi:hypothetical protein
MRLFGDQLGGGSLLLVGVYQELRPLHHSDLPVRVSIRTSSGGRCVAGPNRPSI